MKQAVWLVFLGMYLVCNSFAAAGLRIMESMVMPSRILKQDVHFSVCLPKDYYETKQSFSVVYLLHGLGDDETSWLEYGRVSQFADKAVEEMEAVPMIFVMPEAFRTYYVNDYKGAFLYGDMFVNELVPYIDSLFRTFADRQHRALMGYSMGGFGALVLHLKHPDLFGASVPLSISVRTDEQYMSEDASGWDEQWGRLFGEPGFKGADRITEFYKQNSPFHLLRQLSPADIKKLKIYIDNGDKEQTLCRSNEELHILMRKLEIPHEFRVRDGGHSFGYWCSALPDALRFISDASQGRPYRGNKAQKPSISQLPENRVPTTILENRPVFAYFPSGYWQTNRLYPVIYFAGNFTSPQRNSISALVEQEIENNTVCPMLLVFLSGKEISGLKELLPEIEGKLRIRKGYRFRALAAYRDKAFDACKIAVNKEQFSSCILTDACVAKDSIASLLAAMQPKSLERTAFFVDSPDQGNFYEGNGNMHILLRDKDLQHEYRVREGNGGFDWFISGLPEILRFASKRFHK